MSLSSKLLQSCKILKGGGGPRSQILTQSGTVGQLGHNESQLLCIRTVKAGRRYDASSSRSCGVLLDLAGRKCGGLAGIDTPPVAIHDPWSLSQWRVFRQQKAAHGSRSRAAVVRLAGTLAPNAESIPALEPEELFYSDRSFNRAAERRKDTEWLSKALTDPSTKVLPVYDRKSLFREGRAVILQYTEVLEGLPREGWTAAPIFLGVMKNGEAEEALFALDVTGDASRMEDSPPSFSGAEGADFVDLRKEGPNLPASEAALLSYGRGLVDWQTRTRFCGKDGAPMERTEAGHAMKCSVCGASVYPRLDPAVIMLVTCGDHVLLGRQKRWAAGRYSCLAGFAELGETLEMAVAREVAEEAGVRSEPSSVRYVASQPWPFPSSLMIGFNAEAAPKPFPPELETLAQILASTTADDPSSVSGVTCGDSNGSSSGFSGGSDEPGSTEVDRGDGEMVRARVARGLEPGDLESLTGLLLPEPGCDDKELEDVRWFHRDWLQAALSLQPDAPEPSGAVFGLPGKYAIARRLISDWLEQPCGEAWAGDSVKQVEIDDGTFKYVLLRLRDASGRSKLLVRGSVHAPYHNDVYERSARQVRPLGLQLEVLGGGRIEHLMESKLIHVYGFSYAFGPAKHELTAAVLRKWYPLYDSITTSDEGY